MSGGAAGGGIGAWASPSHAAAAHDGGRGAGRFEGQRPLRVRHAPAAAGPMRFAAGRGKGGAGVTARREGQRTEKSAAGCLASVAANALPPSQRALARPGRRARLHSGVRRAPARRARRAPPQRQRTGRDAARSHTPFVPLGRAPQSCARESERGVAWRRTRHAPRSRPRPRTQAAGRTQPRAAAPWWKDGEER